MFNSFMEFAYLEAKNAFLRGEFPVGCVAVYENKVIAACGNEVERRKDRTAHAEMLILEKLRKIFDEKTFFGREIHVYSTLEPCCMCASAISMHGISKVYYGAEDAKFGGIGRIFANNSGYFKPEIYFLESAEILELMKNFGKSLRHGPLRVDA